MQKEKLLIQIKDLMRWFDDSPSLVFDKFNMEVCEWDFYLVHGNHGAGKSTLTKLLTGVIKSHPKMIYHKMNDLAKFSSENWKEYRRSISLITKNDNLISTLSVKENIIYPLEIKWIAPQEIEKKWESIQEITNLEKIKNNKTHQLSLAEKHIVSVARALIKEPELVISDGMIDNIDKWIAKKLIDMLIKMNHSWATIIFFTYDKSIQEYISGKTKIKTIDL